MKNIGILTVMAFALTLALGCNQTPKVEISASESAPKILKAEVLPTPATPTAIPKSTPVSQVTSTSLEDFPFDVNLKDADGNVVNTKELLGNGKPTAILFWLTTCPPCKQKFIAIERKYRDWKQQADFDLIAVSVDWPKNAEKFSAMVKEKNWPWPTYHDYERQFRNIMPGNLNGLPQEFLFDKNGEMVYHRKRFLHGFEDLLFKEIQKAAAD